MVAFSHQSFRLTCLTIEVEMTELASYGGDIET